MTWNLVGTWTITDFKTLLPATFDSRLAVVVSAVNDLRPTWNYAGFFYQMVDIPLVGLSRIELKTGISIQDPIIFIPQNLHLPYQLKFQKADWINSLILTLYEDSMPLNYSPDTASFTVPNQFASAAISATIPVSAASVNFLGVSPNRKKLIIGNNSNQDLYIDFDGAASVADHSVKIPKTTANGFIATYEIENYTGVVSGIWAAAGTGAALIRELVL
jgi:hypothetical protein